MADGLKHRSEEKVIEQVAAILGIGANRGAALAAGVLPGMPNKDGT